MVSSSKRVGGNQKPKNAYSAYCYQKFECIFLVLDSNISGNADPHHHSNITNVSGYYP